MSLRTSSSNARIVPSSSIVFGHDVRAVAAGEAADRHDRRRFGDVHRAADDRLQAHHDLRADDDRIDAAPRHGAVRLPALDLDQERVGARHQRSGPIDDLAGGERKHVQAEHRVDLRILEHALLDHLLGAAGLAWRRTFFGRLEDHLHRARQPILHARERGRGAEQDRHVVVVTARVHHAGLLAVPLRLRRRLERQIDLLGDRQRIHVGSQRHDRARPCRRAARRRRRWWRRRSSPRSRASCSSSAMIFAVRVSRLPSSGFL